MAVVVEINGRRRKLFRCGRDLVSRRLAIARSGVPYVYADVGVVHTHACAATKLGRQSGRCNCGGEQLLRKVLSA